MSKSKTPRRASRSAAPHGWPKLVEITALVSYSVVVYADSKEQALEHVKTWEHAWDANADLIGVSDVDVLDVRAGTPEDAHEVTANAPRQTAERSGASLDADVGQGVTP
ncbi:MAG: hypothetical protein WCS01_16800 [bacterium]